MERTSATYRTSAPAAPSTALMGGVVLPLAAVAMSLSSILVRLSEIGPVASAFWRVALALPVLWAWMRAEEANAGPNVSRDRLAAPTLLAGLAFAGDLTFWHLSVLRTTVANATFFATCAPIWVVLFGWLLFGRRVGRHVLGGIGLCVAGGTALVARSFAFDPTHASGDALGIATGVFFGLYFLAVGDARARAGAARVTFEASLVTAAALLAITVACEPRLLPRSTAGWSVVLALALVSHVGGQGLLSVALGRLPVGFSSLVIFLEAIAAAALAWAVLGEAITPFQACGGIVILAGIWVARPRTEASA